MRRVLTYLFCAAVVAVLGAVAQARAMMVIAPPPGATRVALADAIVIGRVVSLEKDEVSLPAYPGAPATAKTNYRVAVVQVAEAIKGAKGLKTVRVGFFAPPKMIPGGPVPPGGGIRPIRPGFRPGLRRVELQVGQSGLLYLTKSADKDLYLIPGMYDFTQSTSPNYDNESQEARKGAKLLADPMAGLKAKDNSTRFLTAALLITQYRHFRPGKNTTEPIDAEESKLILQALADADWNAQPAGRVGRPLTPLSVFYQLGVTAKDGWQPPKRITSPQDFPNAARAWLREHAGTYRIQRIVPAPATATTGTGEAPKR